MKQISEGDKCPECGEGTLSYERQQGICSCHINPPCPACVDTPLVCSACGFKERVAIVNDYRCVVGDDDNFKSWRPRELDKTKIDWRSIPHTHFTMRLEGCYPEGTTAGQVEEKVKGTFGGRFEHFGDGKFTYIAYTD